MIVYAKFRYVLVMQQDLSTQSSLSFWPPYLIFQGHAIIEIKYDVLTHSHDHSNVLMFLFKCVISACNYAISLTFYINISIDLIRY